MAVDYLSAVSHGVLSATGTNQLGINARFASWGLLTVAPAAAVSTGRYLGKVIGSLFNRLIGG